MNRYGSYGSAVPDTFKNKKKHNNYVNHIALVLDASYSMDGNVEKLIEVADSQIAHLAQRSQELDQETRVTIYSFHDTVECLVWDMDVLRLPSIKELYRLKGNTALALATTQAIDDLLQVPTKYGDHSFLVFVLTDGEENRSLHEVRIALPHRIEALPDNWTVAFLVPNILAKRHTNEVVRIPKENIAVWDTVGAHGVEEAGSVIRDATDRFMQGRLQGVRGTRSVFSTGAEAVNKATIQAANLVPLSPAAYVKIPVTQAAQIRPWVEQHDDPMNRGRKMAYASGHAYYELTKSERIQPTKAVAIVHRDTGEVYVGAQARQIIGLPDMEVRVKPDHNADYKVFVQSKSVNRNLVAGTELLYMR